MRKSLGRLARKIRRPLATAWCCNQVRPVWHPGFLSLYVRGLRLCKRTRQRPIEAHHIGQFAALLTPEGPEPVVSRRALTNIEKRLNPASAAPLCQDKGIFCLRCIDVGAPAPDLYAVLRPDGAGWRDGREVRDERDGWERWLLEGCPEAFVTKPAWGGYGRGFRIYRRQSGRFVTPDGEQIDAAVLHRRLTTDRGGRGSVVQQRLVNHPDIVRLSGSEYLQTLRIITLVKRDGTCDILHAHLKSIVGDQIIDNLRHGRTGALSAKIDLASGTLMPAVRECPGRSGVLTFDRHPSTGIVFDGYRVPLWAETCRVVRAASIAMLPLRTLGWDVAVTRDGPKAVEANAWWDPFNRHRCMPAVAAALEAELTADDRAEIVSRRRES